MLACLKVYLPVGWLVCRSCDREEEQHIPGQCSESRERMAEKQTKNNTQPEYKGERKGKETKKERETNRKGGKKGETERESGD